MEDFHDVLRLHDLLKSAWEGVYCKQIEKIALSCKVHLEIWEQKNHTWSKQRGRPFAKPSQSTPRMGSGLLLRIAAAISLTSSGFVIITYSSCVLKILEGSKRGTCAGGPLLVLDAPLDNAMGPIWSVGSGFGLAYSSFPSKLKRSGYPPTDP